MNKKKKSFTHPDLKRKRKDLEGFEDVMDMIPGNRFNPERKIHPKMNEDFELLNLLENEQKRLHKLDLFLNEKIHNEQSFDQTEELLRRQQEELEHLREQIIDEALHSNSTLFQNIEKMMLTCFRQADRPS